MPGGRAAGPEDRDGSGEAGSLSAASRKLGIPLPTVSRKLSELETHLKTRLFIRSTRKLALTEAGAAYLPACKRILEQIGDAERAASGEYLSLRGLVQLENTLSMIRENLNPDVAIEGILATMFDKRLLHSKEAVDILKENFGDLVYKTMIRKTIRYAEAPVKGLSVLKYDPTGEAAELYRDLAREVLRGAKAREHA